MRSTGIDTLSPEHVARIKAIGCNAIEFSCNNVERLDGLATIQGSDVEGFKYVALHAPALKFVYRNDVLTKAVLNALQEAHRRLKFRCVVLHPDRVEDWEVLKKFELPYAIENMDNRKEVGKTVEDMEAIFSEHDYPMVLDINHCFVNDQSLELAKKLYTRFQDRIIELQVSGYESMHDPLFRTQQWEILQAVPNKKLPIIIESQVTDENELKQEYECVRDYFAKKSYEMGNTPARDRV